MNKVNLSEFIRPDIANMEEYIPVPSLSDLTEKFGEVIKLDSGENQFGYSPRVAKALSNADLFNYYPDSEYKDLRKALALYTGSKLENIMVGTGSDELLDLLLRLILNEGDEVINCPPTFGMYPALIELSKGIIVSIPRKDDFSLDIDAILKQITHKTKALIICSPNNPTGNTVKQDEVITLLETGKLIIVDEAYYEFFGESAISLLSQYENLIILRTLSKWAGIAGLRLGYGIMNQFFVQQLLKIKLPYNLNLAAEIAGKAALQDINFYKKIIHEIIKERERVYEELNKISYLNVFPSGANSLFIQVKEGFSKLKETLESKRITVRYYESALTGNAIKVSIGTSEQNNVVIQSFKELQVKQIKADSIIFDMDGVLVNVSESYRQAIKMTVEYMLKNKYGMKTIVESQDIEAMKAIPGFNNDWDLSFELERLLSKGIKRKEFANEAMLISNQEREDEEYQYMKDIFQGYYLGNHLFYQVYNRESPVEFSKGLITNEVLLIDLAILNLLAQKYRLGIATSRPRFEALFALKNLKVTPDIIKERYIVAQEDAPREKPAPDPLIEVKTRMKTAKPVYIGDSINDTIASQKANMPCIFIGVDKLGDIQITDVNRIKEVLL